MKSKQNGNKNGIKILNWIDYCQQLSEILSIPWFSFSDYGNWIFICMFEKEFEPFLIYSNISFLSKYSDCLISKKLKNKIKLCFY